MRLSRRFLSPFAIVLPLLLGVPGPARAEDSIRCGSRLVSVEALAPAVVASCGEPSYRDVRKGLDPTLGKPTEVWYYDRGPNQLIQVLSFLNDRLEKIDTDGYGFSGPATHSCEPHDLVEGLSKYRLLRQCGEPVSRQVESALEPTVQAYRDRYGRIVYGGGYPTPVYREVWIYNFGSRYLLRRLQIDDGIVVRIDDDERGFDSP